MDIKRNGDGFDDIRPYRDQEVAQVLMRLLQSSTLVSAVLAYRLDDANRWLKAFSRPFIWHRLQRQVRRIQSVDDFQQWLLPWAESILSSSACSFEVGGLAELAPSSHLFVSNHRDIAMDPTLVNVALKRAGLATSQIAIGDNLLGHPAVADIMRLNKSFVVKRNVRNKRDKLAELKRLSLYIRTVREHGESVWIAQREGRSKDGVDKTDPAVLKMLALHGRDREETFCDSINALGIVPVAVQYEWDPCDLIKAKQFLASDGTSDYQKSEHEDLESIIHGLRGYKGRVCVHFGTPLPNELDDAAGVANAIDAQIQTMMTVFANHIAALMCLQELGEYLDTSADACAHTWSISSVDIAKSKLTLEERVAGEPINVQRQVFLMYASPLIARLG